MPRFEWRFPGEVVLKPVAFKNDCDHVRRQIAAFLAVKTMTKKAFLKQCGGFIGKETVNSGSYAAFMALKGPNAGEDHGLYKGALAFFSSSATSSDVAAAAAAAPSKAAASLAFKQLCDELDYLELPEADDGEDITDEISCTALRSRLTQFIAAHGITQSSLMVYLGVKAPTWSNFMKYTGAFQGSQSGLYASGCAFFTKLRLLKESKKQGARAHKAKPFAGVPASAPVRAAIPIAKPAKVPPPSLSVFASPQSTVGIISHGDAAGVAGKRKRESGK